MINNWDRCTCICVSAFLDKEIWIRILLERNKIYVLFQLERCCFGCEFCLPFPYLGIANLDPIYVKFMCKLMWLFQYTCIYNEWTINSSEPDICIFISQLVVFGGYIVIIFTQKHITMNDIIVIFVDNYDFSLALDLLQ